MPMQGRAALAMWWEIEPALRAEFGHWHSHEHFPERLSLPGFQRASRWMEEDGPGVFVLYEMQSHEVLSSPAYLQRLNQPTPWSTKMMPHHRGMVRCQCRVLASAGGAVAGAATTLRFDPPGTPQWHDGWAPRLDALAGAPGLVGAHLLLHEAPAIAATTEQRIRGGDRTAGAVLVLMGYDVQALDAALQEPALAELARSPGAVRGRYRLAQSSVAGELTATA